MRRQFELGSYFGIPLRVDASWFLVLVLVSWSLATRVFPLELQGLPLWSYGILGVVAAVSLFGCVLLHEFGHSLVAKSYGIPVHHVTLFLFGGVAQMSLDPKRPRVEFFVAAAGPVVSLAIAVGGFWLSRLMAAGLPAVATHPLAGFYLTGWVMLRYLVFVNVAIMLFNLLPGFPLDGGRILRASLWAWLKDVRRATRIASWFGTGLGVVLLALGAFWLLEGRWVNGLWYILLGLYLREAAKASYDTVLMREGWRP